MLVSVVNALVMARFRLPDDVMDCSAGKIHVHPVHAGSYKPLIVGLPGEIYALTLLESLHQFTASKPV